MSKIAVYKLKTDGTGLVIHKLSMPDESNPEGQILETEDLTLQVYVEPNTAGAFGAQKSLLHQKALEDATLKMNQELSRRFMALGGMTGLCEWSGPGELTIYEAIPDETITDQSS